MNSKKSHLIRPIYTIPSSRNFKFDRYRSDIRFNIRYQISKKYADGTSSGLGDEMSTRREQLYVYYVVYPYKDTARHQYLHFFFFLFRTSIKIILLAYKLNCLRWFNLYIPFFNKAG